MTEQEILEGNILIAESPFGDCKVNRNVKVYQYERFDGHEWAAEGLKYHSSWDWLIPVWGKLRNRVWQKNKGSYPETFKILSIQFKIECFNATIITVFEVVVEGIKWYNETYVPRETIK